MSLFNRNLTETPVTQPSQTYLGTPSSIETTRPEVKEEDFIDTSDPNDFYLRDVSPTNPYPASASHASVKGTSKYPIHEIYDYLEQDLESLGQRDAEISADLAFMNMAVENIKHRLLVMCDKVRMQYETMTKKVSSRIDNLSSFGFSGTLNDLNAEIEIYRKHLEKLGELEEKISNDAPAMTSLLGSYKRGFALGVAKKTQDDLTKNTSKS